MKKKSILIVLSIVLLIGVYFAYKGICLYKYNIAAVSNQNYVEVIESLKFENTLTIKKELVDEDNYLVFNNIKVKNIFENYTKLDYPQSTDTYVKYVLRNEEEKVVSSFWMAKTESYVKMFQEEINLFSDADVKYPDVDMTAFFRKNDIYNDIDLFKFLQQNMDKKSNIFTSVKDMKENYAIQLLVAIGIPKVDNLS